MGRSKKKEQKRREEYNKAVKHKMESAADLADKYARAYELSPQQKSNAYKRNRRIVNQKLALVIGGILIQTLVLLAVAILVSVPFRESISRTVENYFSTEKPKFSTVELSENFIGSKNETENVHYTEVEQPESNSSYAVISTEKFSSKIYYGITDRALLSGVAQLSSTSLPGFEKPILLYGYSWTYFSGLQSVSLGDVLSVTTNYGVYKYEVKEIKTFSSSDEVPYDLEKSEEQLILCTDGPFGQYKTETGETVCIIADKVSGPEIVY